MAGLLQDKVALVTGAASGIGRATALAMAREGASVVVSDINVEGGEETVTLIGDQSRAAFVHADVTNAASVDALVTRTVEIFGTLDCAVNNAGVLSARAPMHEIPDETYDYVMDVNVRGVWLCMKREIVQMLEQGSGAIVNTASCVGLVAVPGASEYVASKHAVVGLTRTAAVDYAADGIRVNCVCPGNIKTDMTRSLWTDPERLKLMISRQPIGRLGESEEVAEAIVWLSSDAASFVTGHPMSVDGGLVSQ